LCLSGVFTGRTARYDNRGNLIYDGTNTYTWDRANRLAQLSDGTDLYTYFYNGDGNRVSQSKNTTLVTKYLLDLQPGLALVIVQTEDDTDTTRYIHSPRGIHAAESPTGDWTYQIQDGLGSVRSVIDADGLVAQAIGYTPYGVADSNYEWVCWTNCTSVRIWYSQRTMLHPASNGDGDPYCQ
jgi:hypothetical protein